MFQSEKTKRFLDPENCNKVCLHCTSEEVSKSEVLQSLASVNHLLEKSYQFDELEKKFFELKEQIKSEEKKRLAQEDICVGLRKELFMLKEKYEPNKIEPEYDSHDEGEEKDDNNSQSRPSSNGSFEAEPDARKTCCVKGCGNECFFYDSDIFVLSELNGIKVEEDEGIEGKTICSSCYRAAIFMMKTRNVDAFRADYKNEKFVKSVDDYERVRRKYLTID